MAQLYVSGNFSENGSSSSLLIKEKGMAFVGATGAATFSSGVVVIEVKGPDGLWYSNGDSFDASDVKSLNFSLPAEVRLTLSGATAPNLAYALQSDYSTP